MVMVRRPSGGASKPNSSAKSMGEKMRALNVEIAIKNMIVAASCL